jgi:hypothetical protein
MLLIHPRQFVERRELCVVVKFWNERAELWQLRKQLREKGRADARHV